MSIIPGSRLPLLSLWLALIVTFALTRVVTARIRRGSSGLRNWNIGGVHVHHQVFGILIMLIAGSLQFAYGSTGPPADGLAALFGIGAALTLDEFALWLRLDDVYWTAEGRSSVDAVFIAIALTGLLLSDFTPLGLGDFASGFNWEASLIVVLNLFCVLIAIYKGKAVIGSLGVMVPFVAQIAAVRLAKPSSPWARSRYAEGSAKLQRARVRFGARYQARWNRVRDLVGRMALVPTDSAVGSAPGWSEEAPRTQDHSG
ncbi:MAG TPA: hypothetical protein VF155_03580 [Candidatus Dormibacteraeota bacterium]